MRLKYWIWLNLLLTSRVKANMLVEFENIAPEASIWIYQANRAFSDDEQQVIARETSRFLEQWAAHGTQLKTAFDIRFNQFLILAVDQQFNHSSGCSIDGSVHFIQQLGQHLNVDFFNRTLVAFYDRGSVKIESLSEVKLKLENGKLNEGSLTFNHLIAKVKDLDDKWMVPVTETWLKKYMRDPVG